MRQNAGRTTGHSPQALRADALPYLNKQGGRFLSKEYFRKMPMGPSTARANMFATARQTLQRNGQRPHKTIFENPDITKPNLRDSVSVPRQRPGGGDDGLMSVIGEDKNITKQLRDAKPRSIVKHSNSNVNMAVVASTTARDQPLSLH